LFDHLKNELIKKFRTPKSRIAFRTEMEAPRQIYETPEKIMNELASKDKNEGNYGIFQQSYNNNKKIAHKIDETNKLIRESLMSLLEEKQKIDLFKGILTSEVLRDVFTALKNIRDKLDYVNNNMTNAK
jgi:hypothetical protein